MVGGVRRVARFCIGNFPPQKRRGVAATTPMHQRVDQLRDTLAAPSQPRMTVAEPIRGLRISLPACEVANEADEANESARYCAFTSPVCAIFVKVSF